MKCCPGHEVRAGASRLPDPPMGPPSILTCRCSNSAVDGRAQRGHFRGLANTDNAPAKERVKLLEELKSTLIPCILHLSMYQNSL